MSDSVRPHRWQPTRLLFPWDSPGKNTGVGCPFLRQGIFLTQGSNPGLPHCMQTLYRLSYQRSPSKTQKSSSKFQKDVSFIDKIRKELYKKDLHDQDNHDGVITHLEPDILECEVKWALKSITTNKAGGGDGIPVELFQILKDDAVEVLHSNCQQIWKTQQWP